MGVSDQEESILHKLPEGEACTTPVSLMSNSNPATRLNSFTPDIRMGSREPADKARPSHKEGRLIPWNSRRLAFASSENENGNRKSHWVTVWRERLAQLRKRTKAMGEQAVLWPCSYSWDMKPFKEGVVCLNRATETLRKEGQKTQARSRYVTSTCLRELVPGCSLQKFRHRTYLTPFESDSCCPR